MNAVFFFNPYTLHSKSFNFFYSLSLEFYSTRIICCHSLLFTAICCHSFPFIVTRCYWLSRVVTRCDSLSFVATCCTSGCHSMYHSSVFLSRFSKTLCHLNPATSHSHDNTEICLVSSGHHITHFSYWHFFIGQICVFIQAKTTCRQQMRHINLLHKYFSAKHFQIGMVFRFKS